MKEENSDPVWYCSRCLSLAVIQDKRGVLTCGHCGAGPKHIDFCDYDRWEQLYQIRYGRKQVEKRGIYDDLKEVYDDETPTELTFSEALSNGLCVMDVINRRIIE